MTKMLETCHMYLAIINAITDAVAQSAVEHSGENLFRVEAQDGKRGLDQAPRALPLTNWPTCNEIGKAHMGRSSSRSIGVAPQPHPKRSPHRTACRFRSRCGHRSNPQRAESYSRQTLPRRSGGQGAAISGAPYPGPSP